MAMIKAIFNKATSPAILSTYGEVLNAVADTMITNMPYEDITSLVKMQLSDMSGWNITSYSVTGYGGHGGVLLHARSGPVGHVARL